ncbi:hypothetical protein P3T76_000031 [Phytophthora citrophthora]|uniref:Uncharacterized protein n=1 Tax=Phytophthora citrophthora TaxID=4793 RepID=A0AAD9H027_9STRA|nr:hypothetical protein P3T76_000031 [Phytophthora citrophthora]
MSPALEVKDGAEVTRGPECVDKIWDEQVDGAWAPGKAPVSLFTTFLKCVQERNSIEAEQAAQEIMRVEPSNRLVQDLLAALKQHDAMEAAGEVEEGESEEEDGSEEDSSSGSDSEEESDEVESENDEDTIEAKEQSAD